MTIKSYRELIVWQKSMDLVCQVYHLSSFFPKEELYALSSQIKRAAISIPSNIAEGYGRNRKNDYLRFYKYPVVLFMSCKPRLKLQTDLNLLKKKDWQKQIHYVWKSKKCYHP